MVADTAEPSRSAGVGRTPEARRRGSLTLRRLMVVVALLALCFATMNPFLASEVGLGILVICLFPGSPTWRRMELGATVGWLVGAVLAFSNPIIDFGSEFLLFWSGLAIAVSWVVRSLVQGLPPGDTRGRASWLFVPAAGLLGLVLLLTDLDFRLRLSLSERALVAQASRTGQGTSRWLDDAIRPVGLFWPQRIEECQGSVLWTTGGFIDSGGIAYIPTGKLPAPTCGDYSFRKVRGPWWIFIEHF